MTCKIKRRSLRCGGRPKADFGSLFTSVIGPALNATGSIVDESIDNNKTTTNGVVNKNTTILSDPTKTPTMRLGGRKKCWIGATIGAATSIAGSLFGNGAKKREMRRQKSIQDWQDATQEAANMTTALNNSQDYQEDYLRQFRTAARLGKTLGAKGIYITDGGDATKIGNNTYLLRGGSHEDVNETGQTGIGINVGGNEVEAEGGEVAQKKNGALRIFSAQPILGNGMSPAQAILRGYNKDKVFSQQQAFKKRNGLKDDGSRLRNGGLTSKDRGSSKHQYSSVSSKNFAGGGRSYPIPTKADAVDALRLAGLHGRSDVKAKVYSRYPELRKKAEIGTRVLVPSSNNDEDFLHIITKDHPTIRKIVNEIFGDEGERRRFIEDLKMFGFVSEDASSIAGASPIFRQPIINAARQAQFIQNANRARQAANANRARQAANYAQQQVDYAKEFSDRMSATLRNIGEQLGIRVNLNPNNSVRRLYSSNFKPTNTNNRITTPRETPINSTTTSATNTHTYSGKTTKFNTKYRSYRNAGFSPKASKNLIKANKLVLYSTIGGIGTIGAGSLINANIDKTDKTNKANKAQLDAYGKPISQYIARPQYKGNTTKGNYQLHDGETRITNGIKYTRRGNTIINHKTNVAYIYDKNGNYTGKADYSKVGNFNQAFDAARAAGRSQFIYRAGKYNNYSTIKETNAKRERLNRIVGARRIAKALGGYSLPVKGMRPKAATGIFVPYNKRYTSIYDAPDYSSDYNGGNVLGNGEVTVTAKRIKPTFMKPNNDAINIINHPANETPYIPQRHNRSRTIFSGGDYLGLGIDTLAALSTGLVNYNTAGKYVLPDRAPIIQASKLPTTYNVNPEIEEVKRYRDRLTGQTFNNTSSSVAALNRSGAINLDALSNLSKLWATKENEENKMLTEDAKNQQTVAAQNVQNELARQSEIARIKNEANQAKGDALNVGLSGLSQAWTNFWTAGRTAYEDDQARRATIASSKDATPTKLMEMDFDLSPDVIAALYRTANEDRTKRFYLSRLSPKQRQKYGIN